MEKEEIVSIVEKVVSTLQENKPAEAVAKAAPQETTTNNNTNDKVVIDLQKSYEKLSGQLDEINRKLTEKQEVKATTEKKPLII